MPLPAVLSCSFATCSFKFSGFWTLPDKCFWSIAANGSELLLLVPALAGLVGSVVRKPWLFCLVKLLFQCHVLLHSLSWVRFPMAPSCSFLVLAQMLRSSFLLGLGHWLGPPSCYSLSLGRCLFLLAVSRSTVKVSLSCMFSRRGKTKYKYYYKYLIIINIINIFCFNSSLEKISGFFAWWVSVVAVLWCWIPQFWTRFSTTGHVVISLYGIGVIPRPQRWF